MKNGFVLLAVMLILFLLGLEFFVLNSTSNVIGNESNTALLEGYNENLLASGAALAKEKKFKTGEIIELATDKLTVRPSKISIKIDNPGEIQISTFCQAGGRELKTNSKISISK